MARLSSFIPFNFEEGVPYISITNNGLTFNKSVIMKMGYPSHVVLLIDSTNKQIAIQACNETTPRATVFYKERNSGVLSVRWNSRDLLNTLSRITGWNLEESAFRANGELIPEENAMIFDLTSATPMG